jgi:hypothetical protein
VGVLSGKTYCAGKFFKVGSVDRDCIAAYDTDGKLDLTFNSANGANDAINDAILTPNGIFIAGNFTSYGGVSRGRFAKIGLNGALDIKCDPGAGANGEIMSMKILEDGRIVLTGKFTQFSGVKCRGTVRISADGTVDATLKESDLNVSTINSTN